jgi:hypothetical protein
MTHRVSFVVMQTTKATQPRQLAAIATCFTILEFGNERFAIHLSGSLRKFNVAIFFIGLEEQRRCRGPRAGRPIQHPIADDSSFWQTAPAGIRPELQQN